jgi:hypothetical protein
MRLGHTGFSIPDRSGDLFRHARWYPRHRARLVAPVGAGRHAHQFGEARAEGAQRRAADRETDLGDASASWRIAGPVRGRPGVRCGYVQRRLTSSACQRSSVRGVTIRDSWRRRAVQSRRVRAARIARSVQDSRGDLTWRCRTAIWWRSTRISVFLALTRSGWTPRSAWPDALPRRGRLPRQPRGNLPSAGGKILRGRSGGQLRRAQMVLSSRRDSQEDNKDKVVLSGTRQPTIPSRIPR